MCRKSVLPFSVLICAGLFAAATCAIPSQLAYAKIAVFPRGLHLQMSSAELYSDTADAKKEIHKAILRAGREHKHVLLDFGGNWCPDCKMLDLYFHDPINARLLAANYVLVDVSVGQYDKNLDLASKYGIPLNKGVPALAVLDGSGRVVYAQRNGEFEAMRKLDSAAVTAFLEKWKPKKKYSHKS